MGETPLTVLEVAMRRGDWLCLLALCLACGLWSLRLGTDSNWDLMNYQLYGPYAWLSGRGMRDVAAAQLQSFFNPLGHVPYYLTLRALNDWPRLFAFLMGMPAGLYAFLLGKIILLVLRSAFPAAPAMAWLAAPAWVMGLTGADFPALIGSSSNDVNIGVLVLLALWLTLREAASPVRLEGRGLAWLGLAGLAAGCALGLKMTHIMHAAPLGLMILAFLGLRAAAVAGTAMVAGFLVSWGGWGLFLWHETGNPLFPLYNQYFRSPDFPPVRTSDDRFLPRSLWQALFYPFWWLRQTSGLVTELTMRDPRVAMGMLGLAGLAVAALRALPWRWEAMRRQRALLLLLGFLVLAQVIWTLLFGIYRYLLLVESLGGLLVVLALGFLLRARAAPALALGCLATLVAMAWTVRPDWSHLRYGPKVVDIGPMPVAEGDLLMTIGGEPMAYLIPFMPAGVKVLGGENNIVNPSYAPGLGKRIDAALGAHHGRIWLLSDPALPMEELTKRITRWGLATAGECSLIKSNLQPQGHRFCTATRRGNAPG